MSRLDPMTNPYPPEVGKLTDDQIAQRDTWNTVGTDSEATTMALTSIRQARTRSSTVTTVNQLDPASAGWIDPPGAFAPVIGATRP